MFYVEEYMPAVVLCVVSMLCWGSWGNSQKLAGKWPYKYFYWDYVSGMLTFAIIWGLTAGSSGGGEWSFVHNLGTASKASLGYAFAGGVVFNAANILLVAAIAAVGLSIAFPVGCGLSLVLGTVFNYIVKPKGDAMLIFSGIGLITIAIILIAMAGAKKSAGVTVAADEKKTSLGKGLMMTIACGVLMSLFYPFVAKSMDMNFTNPAPAAGLLTPYTAFFMFVLGAFVSTFAFNPINFKKFFSEGSGLIHLAGIFGAVIWSFGTAVNFVAAGPAGASIAFGLGQGATLVSALWGIFIWREFKGAPRICAILNMTMFILFIAGLALLIKAGS